MSSFGAKLPKALECLAKDKDEMLALNDSPAEYGRHLRTSNPIESTFATVLKLAMSAPERWRRHNGHEQLGALIEGLRFEDGVSQENAKADDVAA
ncbi:MAG: hypothetical protein ACPGPE_00840 [Planctomycetota bacterium]